MNLIEQQPNVPVARRMAVVLHHDWTWFRGPGQAAGGATG